MKNNYNTKQTHGLGWRIFLSVLLFAVGASQFSANAQRVSASGGVYTIDATGSNTGTNFTSFSNAIADLNIAGPLTGNVVFNVIAGQTFAETPLIITATGNSGASITFQKSGSTANPIISSTGSNLSTGDAAVTIRGGDYITFDGINVTAVDSSLEFGYLVRKASYNDAARNNTITNATVLMHRLKTYTYAILQSNDSIIGSTSTAYPSSLQSNSNNTYTYNTIGSSFNGIWLKGFSTTYRDSNNIVNNNSIGRSAVNNDLGAFSGLFNAYGAYLSSQYSPAITGNNIRNIKSTYYIYPIYVDGSTLATVSNNDLTGFDITINTFYYIYSIYLNNTTAYTISGNNIHHISTTPASSAYVYGIYTASSNNGSIINNQINNNQMYVMYGIYTSSGTNMYYNNNVITSNTSTSSMYGLYIFTITSSLVSNNTISNNNAAGTFYGYYGSTFNSSRFRNNTASNLNTTAGTMYVYYMSGGSIDTLDNNTATNCNASSGIIGIYLPTANAFKVYNNTLSNLQGGGGGTCYAIYATTPNNADIYNNTISNFKSNTGSSAMYGIYTTAITGTCNFYNNSITDFGQTKNAITGTGTVYGWYTTIATTGSPIANFYNNTISDLYKVYTGAATTSRYAYGIYFATTSNATATYNLIHNSISIDGNGALNSTSATLFTAPTTATSPKLTLRNNAFANLTGAQTGVAKHYLIYSSAVGVMGATTTTSNFNDWYLANATNGYFGYSGADKVDMASWIATAGFTTYEANSITGNPLFNSNINLRPSSGSALVGTGTFISGYTTDVSGATRSTSAPTIGAYEIAQDVTAPTITYSNLLNKYDTLNNNLTGFATIVDNGIGAINTNSGFAPRIYFKAKKNANSFGANTSAVDGWKYVESTTGSSPYSFVIDYSLLLGGYAVTGDTIQYFIVAQDTAVLTNLTSMPSAGFVGTSVASITAAPTTPNYYVILGAPAAYVSSDVIQGPTSKVGQGSVDNVILRVKVTTATTGSPAYVSQLTFNTNGGGNDSANILRAKVYYSGSSSSFSTANLFGTVTFAPSVAGPIGAFTVNGNTLISAGDNYFWLVYDLRAAAILTDSVDGEFTSVTYFGNTQSYSGGATAGSRKIRAEFCIPTHAGTNFVTNLVFGTINNSPVAPVTPWYRMFAAGGNTTTSLSRGSTVPLNITYNAATIGSVWIDFNDNGTLETTEWTQLGTSASTGIFNISIPCNAVLGDVRMRIRTRGTGNQNGAGDACTSFGGGECQDYTITIVDNPVSYVSSNAIQTSTVVAPGATDAVVLRVPVLATGCGVGTATAFTFNTTGSTSASDIVAAKLYATGNATTFNTTKLLGTVYSPSGAFTFSGLNDTLLTGTTDTNNYWLAYDVNPSATLSNVLDAQFVSVDAVGSTRTPVNGNPTGSRQINAPMTYVSSTTVQATTSKVETSATNNPILRVEVVTSAIGSPINLTQLDLNTNGTTDTSNIRNIKVFYTGNSSTFAATTQFGSTLAVLPGSTSYSITGLQALTNNTNYFWVTYDIPSTATIGNRVDGELGAITVGGSYQVPTVTAPTGDRQIRNPYCASTASNDNDEEILNVTLGSYTNSSTCGAIAPGPGSVAFRYSNYTTVSSINMAKGNSVPFSLTLGECNTGTYTSSVAIYADWNSDGDFVDANETAYSSLSFIGTLASNGGMVRSGSIFVPCNAALGETRLRVVYYETSALPSSCGSPAQWGETEDYTINILDNPVAYVSSSATQNSSVVAPGATDAIILRVPVLATGCGVGTLNAMTFSTAGSTSASDISVAKLYATGNSSLFSATKLVGTVYSPSGSFTFSGLNDTLLTGTTDTNNYWLAYDINPSAVLNNVVDAQFVSVDAVGSTRTPINGNPTGSRQIIVPMTYVSSTTAQATISKIETGSTNNPILRVEVVTSATGSPISLTQLDLNTNGTTDTSNIRNIKVFYTGNSSTFATTTQFGATLPNLPGSTSYSITGLQALTNNTNYFWVTYDITSGATIGNRVDGELTAVTVGGSYQVPSVSAPTGDRQIRNPYCASTATNDNDEEILSVTLGTYTNTAACGAVAPGPGSVAFRYSNYTTVSSINMLKGTSIPFSLTLGECNLNPYTSSVAIYADWNGDGDFIDAGETAYSSIGFTGVLSSAGGLVKAGNFFVPCNADLGQTRMRIVYYETSAIPASCGSPAQWGETEDYTINIVDNPVAYVSSSAIQNSSVVAPGATDAVVLRVPVLATGCGVGTATAFTFNTTGSTSASDIVSAKLYATGNSNVFTSTKLLGTVFSPSGSFTFFGLNDTLLTNTGDTNNYWLTYDVNPSAALNNLLDAQFVSVDAVGSTRTPVNGNPTGNRQIVIPMTYVSSTVEQPILSTIAQGSKNQRIARLKVTTSATGSPISLTSLDVNTNGTTSLADITNIKVWYTGSNANLDTTIQFGATVGTPSAFQTFSGTQALANGVNYFWVTYSVSSTATLNNNLDAEVTAITIGSVNTPTVTAPTGERKIRAEYCTSMAYYNTIEDIGQVALSQFGVSKLTNGSCTPQFSNPDANKQYTDFTGTVAVSNLTKGSNVDFSICAVSGTTYYTGAYLAIYVDLNQNGSWDAGEQVYTSSTQTTATPTFTGSFFIPNTALTGETRMRVLLQSYNVPTLASACYNVNTNYYYGEAEDYVLNIMDLPAPTAYTWNVSGSGNFNTASNWTPSRTIPLANDMLIVNGGTTTMTNVSNAVCKSLNLYNNANVTLTGTGTIVVQDTLNITAGSRVSSTTNTIVVGWDTTTIGYVSGSGLVNATIKRWTNSATTNYLFPIASSANNRAFNINYSTYPTVSGSITARFVTGAPGSSGMPLTDASLSLSLVNVSNAGIWDITATDGLIGGTFNAVVTADGIANANVPAEIALIYRNTSFDPWTTAGVGTTTTGTSSSFTMTRNGYTSFGQFGIAGTSSNPLPVKWLGVKANNNNGDVNVTWVTASEFNNKGFELERSVDGINFKTVTFVKGAGTVSAVKSYSFVDAQAFANEGVNDLYYRVKQLDNDGKFSYSSTVTVTNNDVTEASVLAYPNPFSNTLSIALTGVAAGKVTIEITDISGRRVFSDSQNISNGAQVITLDNLAELNKGVYFISVLTNQGNAKVVKLVKN